MTDAGCIGITDAQGNTYPAVWPRGTSLASGPAIDVPGIGMIELGAAVRGAGGYYEVSTRPVLDEVAERCVWDGEVIGIRFE